MPAIPFCALLLAVLCSVPTVLAQSEAFVEVHEGGGTSKKMSIVPASATVLFPGSEVFLDNMDVTAPLTSVATEPQRQLRFVTIRSATGDAAVGSNSASRAKVTARASAVIYKDRVYVGSELFCDENISAFNMLLRTMGANVDSSEKAMQVAKFYLQLGYYRLEEPGKYVVSTFLQLPPEKVNFPGQNTKELQDAIHPPVVSRDGDGYKVEIVTEDVDAGFVLLYHWSIDIVDSQIKSSEEEVAFPSRLRYRTGEAPSDRFGGTFASPLTALRFQLGYISDGNTPDNKDLGLNVSTYGFNTSDGPQVIRSAYHFNSTERAVKEFIDHLDATSQILEQGKWADEAGNVVGERALVFYSTDGGRRLSAAVLLRRDTRFFEVSSSCLHNLLEFEKAWFQPGPTTKQGSTPN
jgi:hypothetical protein